MTTVRIGCVGLAVTILTAALCGDAVAKIHKGRLHARGTVYESRAQLAPTPVQPGAMRYYGGPKSGMWRGPAEN